MVRDSMCIVDIHAAWIAVCELLDRYSALQHAITACPCLGVEALQNGDDSTSKVGPRDVA